MEMDLSLHLTVKVFAGNFCCKQALLPAKYPEKCVTEMPKEIK